MGRALALLVLLAGSSLHAAPYRGNAGNGSGTNDGAADNQAAAADTHKDRIVQIKQSELDKLKAEIARLTKELQSTKAELNALKGQQAQGQQVQAPPQPQFVLRVEKGVTLKQLREFVAQHGDRYRYSKDVRRGNERLIKLERYKWVEVPAGQEGNGVQKFDLYHKEKRTVSSWEIVLIDDVITDISGDPRVIE